jgi:hypothetical protein
MAERVGIFVPSLKRTAVSWKRPSNRVLTACLLGVDEMGEMPLVQAY